MTYTKQELEKMAKRSGESLDLSGTGITALPEGLTVGGWLDLRGTGITALPEGLTVGGWLDLSGTGITALPEGLTVGGSLDLSGTGIKNKTKEKKKAKKLRNGDYVPNKYVYADGILTHVRRAKKIGEYTYFLGKIPEKNVVSDGTYYAHCKTFKDGVLDIRFKRCSDRGEDQYKKLNKDSVVKYEDAVTMYRIITGACRAGTQAFLDTLKETKAEYTVAEIIEQTRGQFGSQTFARFFEEN